MSDKRPELKTGTCQKCGAPLIYVANQPFLVVNKSVRVKVRVDEDKFCDDCFHDKMRGAGGLFIIG